MKILAKFVITNTFILPMSRLPNNPSIEVFNNGMKRSIIFIDVEKIACEIITITMKSSLIYNYL